MDESPDTANFVRLLDAAKSRDKAACEELLSLVDAPVRARIRSLLHGRADLDLEDAVQEIRCRLLARIDKCNAMNKETWCSWALTLAKNAAIDIAQKQARRRHAPIQPGSSPGIQPPAPSDERPSEEARRAELVKAVQAVIPTLEEPDQTIVRRRYMGGASLAEIASETGLTAGAVAQRLRRARERLRLSLKGHADRSSTPS